MDKNWIIVFFFDILQPTEYNSLGLCWDDLCKKLKIQNISLPKAIYWVGNIKEEKWIEFFLKAHLNLPILYHRTINVNSSIEEKRITFHQIWKEQHVDKFPYIIELADYTEIANLNWIDLAFRIIGKKIKQGPLENQIIDTVIPFFHKNITKSTVQSKIIEIGKIRVFYDIEKSKFNYQSVLCYRSDYFLQNKNFDELFSVMLV